MPPVLSSNVCLARHPQWSSLSSLPHHQSTVWHDIVSTQIQSDRCTRGEVSKCKSSLNSGHVVVMKTGIKVRGQVDQLTYSTSQCMLARIYGLLQPRMTGLNKLSPVHPIVCREHHTWCRIPSRISKWNIVIFIALHVMQTRYSEENSVCLSHAWSLTKRKKDISRFLHHTKEHLS